MPGDALLAECAAELARLAVVYDADRRACECALCGTWTATRYPADAKHTAECLITRLRAEATNAA